jgi:RNA polymerase-binding transcription factor DksA
MELQELVYEQDQLHQARAETLTELNHLRLEMQDAVDFTVDEADELITEHETAAILIAMLEHRLQEIDSALVAMDAGRYEICEYCGGRIEQERLRAKPDARLCIACQQTLESSL